MKAATTLLWILCLLAPIYFYGTDWVLAHQRLDEDTKGIAGAQAHLDKLAEDVKQFPELRAELGRRKPLLQVPLRRHPLPAGASPTGLPELQGLLSEGWTQDKSQALPVHEARVAAPAQQVLKGLLAIVRHPRGYQLLQVELKRRGSDLEGTVRVLARPLPPL